MTVKKLERGEWHPFLALVSKELGAKQAEIEVDSLSLGSQIAAEWIPFQGIDYDPKDDIVEVALEGLDHIINHPREIYLNEEPVGLTSIAIVDGEGATQIVKLRDPLMLPPPPA